MPDNPTTEENPDDIVGHKTLHDGTHIPLRRGEANAILAAVEARARERSSAMPNEMAAINALFEAWLRLKELGWSEAQYCPKDGTSFQAIEAGSTGIHPCFYEGEWPDGHWIVGEGMDCGPGRPILFKRYPGDQMRYEAKMAELRRRYREEAGHE